MSAKETCVRENLLNHYFYDLSLELDMMVSEMVEKKTMVLIEIGWMYRTFRMLIV